MNSIGNTPSTEAWLPPNMKAEAARLLKDHEEIMALRGEVKAMEAQNYASKTAYGDTDQTKFYQTQAKLYQTIAGYLEGLGVRKQAFAEFVSRKLQLEQDELRTIEESLFKPFPAQVRPREVLICSPSWQNQRIIVLEMEGKCKGDSILLSEIAQDVVTAEREARDWATKAAREPSRYKTMMDNRKAEAESLQAKRAKINGEKAEREQQQQSRISALLGKQ